MRIYINHKPNMNNDFYQKHCLKCKYREGVTHRKTPYQVEVNHDNVNIRSVPGIEHKPISVVDKKTLDVTDNKLKKTTFTIISEHFDTNSNCMFGRVEEIDNGWICLNFVKFSPDTEIINTEVGLDVCTYPNVQKCSHRSFGYKFGLAIGYICIGLIVIGVIGLGIWLVYAIKFLFDFIIGLLH